MNILKSYVAGFKKIYEFRKIIIVIFGITILPALVLASSFYDTLTNNFPLRSELYSLLKDFNATVYFDFMNNYGDMIKPFTSLIVWLGVFYFLFTVFFSGGILKLLDGSSIKSNAQAFFAGSAKFFFRFLRLGIYVLFFQAITFAVIAIGFSSIFNRALPDSTEPKLFAILVIWIGFHLLAFIFYSVIADYAKIILVKEDSRKVFRALWHSLLFSVRKSYLVYPLYFMLLIAPLILIVLNLGIDQIMDSKGNFWVLVSFVVQQFFICCRLFAKFWILGSEYDLFANYLLMKNQPLITQEMLIGEML